MPDQMTSDSEGLGFAPQGGGGFLQNLGTALTLGGAGRRGDRSPFLAMLQQKQREKELRQRKAEHDAQVELNRFQTVFPLIHDAVKQGLTPAGEKSLKTMLETFGHGYGDIMEALKEDPNASLAAVQHYMSLLAPTPEAANVGTLPGGEHGAAPSPEHLRMGQTISFLRQHPREIRPMRDQLIKAHAEYLQQEIATKAKVRLTGALEKTESGKLELATARAKLQKEQEEAQQTHEKGVATIAHLHAQTDELRAKTKAEADPLKRQHLQEQITHLQHESASLKQKTIIDEAYASALTQAIKTGERPDPGTIGRDLYDKVLTDPELREARSGLEALRTQLAIDKGEYGLLAGLVKAGLMDKAALLKHFESRGATTEDKSALGQFFDFFTGGPGKTITELPPPPKPEGKSTAPQSPLDRLKKKFGVK